MLLGRLDIHFDDGRVVSAFFASLLECRNAITREPSIQGSFILKLDFVGIPPLVFRFDGNRSG